MPLSVMLGRLVVKYHDEQGLPHQLGFAELKNREQTPSLLGVMIEASNRGWSKKLLREAFESFAEHFTPTINEQKAMQFIAEVA